MKSEVWLELIKAFAPLSFLTIGGGQSIVADIHRQAVVNYGWMTDAEFVELFGISRVTPGPGSLLVTLVGWTADGWLGALVASLCIFLPTSIVIYFLARLWGRYRTATWPRAIETGLAPLAAGMVLAAACTILRASEHGVLAWSVTGAATLALLFTRINTFVLVGACALIFIVVL